MNFICLFHPKYKATDAPILSCKACCKLYINRIRNEQKNTEEKTMENPFYTPPFGEGPNEIRQLSKMVDGLKSDWDKIKK